MRKARITVSSEFTLDSENYKDVEWPPGSGETKSLTDPEEMLEFERHMLKTGEVDALEMLGGHDEGHGEDTKLELVPEESSATPSTGWRDEATGLTSGGLVTDD